jgi:hypothetical protein
LSEVEVVDGHISECRDRANCRNGNRRPILRRICGLGPRQLENEIEQGSWLRAAATVEAAFSTPDDIWLRHEAIVGWL